MASSASLHSTVLSGFKNVVREEQSLAPFTWLRIGGPTRYLIEPDDQQQLVELVRICQSNSIPMKLMGGGSNLLIRETGFGGATLVLSAPAFNQMSRDGNRVRCGGGAKLSHLIAFCVGQGLGGLEHLIGIPGSVGGALKGNSGTSEGDIGQAVESVQLLTAGGSVVEATGKQLAFSYRESSLDELAILEVVFRLEPGDVRALTKREQTFWILKRGRQPSFPERAAVAFINPTGYEASDLLLQAGFNGSSEGAIRLSSTYPNFLIASAGATSDQVLTLLDRVREGVHERTGVQLQSHLQIW
ncbi:MAG: FAD-binding protein [Pirellula sp.]